MYLKLTLRNAKRSICDYLLYIVTITILIVIMAVSNFVARMGKMQADFQTISLPLLITLILVILTGYINQFMLKQRAKEFANYMLLGMEKSMLSKMFLTEFLAVGLVCFVIGGLIGSVIYLVFHSIIISPIKGAEIRPFFFTQSLIQTFLYFCVVEFLSMHRIRRNIDKLQIRELMLEKKRNQKLGGKRQVRLWGILFVASLLSFKSLLFCIAFLPEDIIFRIISIIILPLILAVFAFYKWLYQFFAVLRQRQSETLYQKNRLYMIAQMTSETKTNAVMNSVFCMCLIFSVISFIFGVMMLQPEIKVFDAKSQQWMGFLQINLCIIFIVIYFSILSLQQIIELKQEAKALQILHYIGKTTAQIRALIKKQVLIKLSMPTAMCFLPLTIAVPLLHYKLNTGKNIELGNILIKSIGWFTIGFLILYLCYLFVVLAATKQYVENAINTKF